jgi:hypothetical protein
MRFKLIAVLALSILVFVQISSPAKAMDEKSSWWKFQSIDVMKYSRDLAREKINDPGFDAVIDQQVKNIASVGATHVAIGTPYDEEFVPFLKRWVKVARKYNLSVWFRGNWSGWEGWFGYDDLNREGHLKKIPEFIAKHKDLFADGDVFTACPECENGGPGDPRQTGNVEGYRQFLLNEYTASKTAFSKLGKDVTVNFFSMNADVAKLIMNRETTQKLGGVVTIDHYVKSPEQLAEDVDYFAKETGGKVVLGEFGAPIPDIHGKMSDKEQSEWIEKSLALLATRRESLLGLNYWVSVGGSTQIWDGSGQASPAVAVIKKYFSPDKSLSLVIKNDFGQPVSDIPVDWMGREYETNQSGVVAIPYVPMDATPGSIVVNGVKAGFSRVAIAPELTSVAIPVQITKENPGLWYKIQRFFYSIFKR